MKKYNVTLTFLEKGESNFLFDLLAKVVAGEKFKPFEVVQVDFEDISELLLRNPRDSSMFFEVMDAIEKKAIEEYRKNHTDTDQYSVKLLTVTCIE